MPEMNLESALRLLAYWTIVFFTCWSVAFHLSWPTNPEAGMWWDNLFLSFRENKHFLGAPASILAFAAAPIMLASSLSILILTKQALPVTRTSWINKLFAMIPWFKSVQTREGKTIVPRNQFFTSEINFNLLGAFLTIPPSLGWVIGYPLQLFNGDYAMYYEESWARLEMFSIFFGFASLISLTFFLIPVARHSVVLVAMGWSPVHAMRIHVWCGYVSFWCCMIHGTTYVPVWWHHKDEGMYDSVWQQIIPEKECWAWKMPSTTNQTIIEQFGQECRYQMFNISGIIAGIFYITLTVTSLNYFRRRMYAFFYKMHAMFGTLTVLGILFHWNYAIIFLLPSICYYFASTTPILIQALATRYRGGNQVVSIKHLKDAGRCKEIAIRVTPEVDDLMNHRTNQFVKLCVPSISLVWHPFTVYKNPSDPTTLRILFRPIGPFSNAWASALEQEHKLIHLVDGLYHGSNYVSYAVAHDQIAIVAGGVTITPYLSFIPKLLDTIATTECPGKKIVLHWACREQGLLDFVKSKYFNVYFAQAAKIHKEGFKFEVRVYFTGGSKKLQNSEEDSEADITKEIEPSKECDEEMSKHDTSDDSNPPSNADEEVGGDPAEGETLRSDDDSKAGTASSGKGIPMELGRINPGRYKKIWWNLPQAIGFGSILWISFWFFWRWLDAYQNAIYLPEPQPGPKRNIYYTPIWGVFIFFIIAIFLGVCIESLAYMSRNKWPRPKLATHDSDDAKGMDDDLTATEADNSSYKVIPGRPTMDQIFNEDMREAEAPGIFLCAPVPLMDAVKKEARKENSAFLLKTRYPIYEEPFEF